MKRKSLLLTFVLMFVGIFSNSMSAGSTIPEDKKYVWFEAEERLKFVLYGTTSEANALLFNPGPRLLALGYAAERAYGPTDPFAKIVFDPVTHKVVYAELLLSEFYSPIGNAQIIDKELYQ